MRARDDEVICPGCAHQFRAVPLTEQAKISVLRAALEDALPLLKQLHEHDASVVSYGAWKRAKAVLARLEE